MFDILDKRNLIEMGLKPRKRTFYERYCSLLEKKIQIPVPAIKQEQFQSAINFCHLEITPRGPILFSGIFTISLLLILLIVGLLNIIPGFLIFLLFLGILGMGYYFFNYPFYYTTQYKIKASSEMVLAIVYMTVSMKIKSNLESAIVFTASNLRGPLGVDMNELIWDLFNGKYFSSEDAIEHFIEKWKMENQEFTQSMNMVKTSINQGPNERDFTLNEAIRIILEGTRVRMKGYSRDLKSSLTILNALGILLPIIGLMFFPMITIFMPEAIKPIFIALGYDIILPSVVFFLMMVFLKKRPTTFHQPEVLITRKNGFRKFLDISIILPVTVSTFLISIGLYNVITSTEQFNFVTLLFSIMILAGVALGIGGYCILSTYRKLKLKNEIIEMENELHIALFQVGYQLRSGGSVESNILKLESKIQELKISKLFNSIISNIQMFGVTFKKAIFDQENGAIYKYPSYLISAIFKAISEIAQSGSKVLSQSVISISNYLKNMREIEEYLEDMLSEVTSTMKIQSILLAPLSSGIVVGLAAMMMHMLVSLTDWVNNFQSQLSSYGPVGTVGGGVMNSILTVDKILPVSYFQLIVGIYMIEVVTMITLFLSIIKYGDEKIQRNYDIGVSVLIAFFIYSTTVILLYLILTSLITLTWAS